MKKSALMLAVLLSLLQLFCACSENKSGHKTDDPFSFDNKATDDGALSVTESIERYGFPGTAFSLFEVYGVESMYDGMYFYRLKSESGTVNDNGYVNERQYKKLYRVSADTKEIGKEDTLLPACGDPLCTHTPDSGCVFADIIRLACVDGKLIFQTNIEGLDDFSLYEYDPATGSKKLIDHSFEEFSFRKQENDLYYYKKVEEDDFAVHTEAYKYENGSFRKLFDLKPHFEKTSPSYLWDDHLGIYLVGKEIWTYDVLTDKESPVPITTGELSYIGLKELYKDLLLCQCEYTDGKKEWLFCNATTGRVTAIDASVFAYSDKCVLYVTKKDPSTLHILFPETGIEETYDLHSVFDKEIGDLKLISAVVHGKVFFWFSEGETKRCYEYALSNGSVIEHDEKWIKFASELAL